MHVFYALPVLAIILGSALPQLLMENVELEVKEGKSQDAHAAKTR
jgi:hypothetical protein